MAEKYDFNTDTESLLLANDSTIIRVQLNKKISNLTWAETFQRFHAAIANNTVMEELTIDLQDILTQLGPNDGTRLLFQAIEESTCIKTISIMKGFSVHHEWITFISALVSAISSNNNIKSCRFYVVYLNSKDLATLLRRSSLTELEIFSTIVDFHRRTNEDDSPSWEENVQEVTEAFEQNKTLQRLSFLWLPVAGLQNRTILETARRNKSITDFTIHFTKVSDEQYDPQVLAEVATYLNESNVSCVVLDEMNWDNETFDAFTSNINRKASPIKYFRFNDCSFNRNISILLKDFLIGNPHIDAISFGGKKTCFHNEINVLGDIIGNKKGPGILELANYPDISSSTNGMESICTGLASKISQLHTLILPCLSPIQLDCFLNEVPTFYRLRKLRFTLDAETEYLKGKLMSSMLRNGSLYDIIIEAPWMKVCDYYSLNRFADRNLALPALFWYSSNELPKKTLPFFLFSSAFATSGTGPKDIFFMLYSLGDKICKPE